MDRLLISFVIGSGLVVNGFSPTSPPRFDVFSESIVSSWHAPGDSQEDVEEVMRSCGGAVQGIRDNGIYCNRADDGFVFFDCGSYSFGTIDFKGDDSDVAAVSASISVGRDARVYIEGDIYEDGAVDGNLAIRYPRFMASNQDRTMHDNEFEVEMLHTAPLMEINCQIQCRMPPSLSSAWMLQRAKWEIQGDHGDSVMALFAQTQGPEAVVVQPLIGWIASQPQQSSGGCDVSIGTACGTSKAAKALVRSYIEEGNLIKVALQYGKLQ